MFIIPLQITVAHVIFLGGAYGSAKLVSLITELTEKVMPPGYNDYEILINNGSTDGWSKVVDLLTEPGEYILLEKFTFPSAQGLWAPKGCRAAPIAIDAQGIVPEDLERILKNWDVDQPGVKQPHL